MENKEVIEKTPKEVFLDLISELTLEFDKEKLVEKLENSDFFSAPASTMYSYSYNGGLVDHCIDVYNICRKLNETMGLNIPNQSILIVSLFHDFYKMNFYEVSARNKKVYSELGNREDSIGRFNWKEETAYKVRDDDNRFIYGTNGETAEFMIRYFIPLTMEESIAIINCTNDDAKYDIGHIYARHPLAYILHIADYLSMFNNNWREKGLIKQVVEENAEEENKEEVNE